MNENKLKYIILFLSSIMLFTSCSINFVNLSNNNDNSCFSDENISQNNYSSSNENESFIIPTGTFLVTIIDPNNFITNKQSINNNYFAPGTKITLNSTVLTDVDLAMYINDQFHSIHTSYHDEIENRYKWKFEFIMPAEEVKISFQTKGTSYTAFDSIYSWINELNSVNVKEVRLEKGFIGVAPGSLVDISYSKDELDINNSLSLLDSLLVEAYEYEYQISGGGYIKYTYYTKSSSYSFRLNNGFLFTEDKVYKFLNYRNYFTNPYKTCNSFITYLDNYEVYEGEYCLGEYSNLSVFEFKSIHVMNELLESVENIYLKTEFGEIHILDYDKFYIINESIYYVFGIVGENNFSFIFDMIENESI